MAMGAPDLAPVCDHMSVPRRKGRAPSEDELARAEKAKADCTASLAALKAWLTSIR
jgi:hypothetical protein